MYRRATINDLEQIEKIANNRINKDTLLSTFNGNEKYIYVFEEENMGILGVMYFGSDDVDDDDFDSEIFGIYAINNERLAENIKAEMLFQTKRELYEKGYRNLIIWCSDDDEVAKKFYSGTGGIETKKRNNNDKIEVAYSFELIDYPN